MYDVPYLEQSYILQSLILGFSSALDLAFELHFGYCYVGGDNSHYDHCDLRC